MSTTVKSTDTAVYAFDGFRLNAANRILTDSDGNALPLMPKAFDILLYLVTNSGRAIDKDELMSAIWTDTIVEENNLTQNVSAIRRVLGEKHGENRFIATLPGRGYKFVADVSEIDRAVVQPETVTADISAAQASQWSPKGRFWFFTLGATAVLGVIMVGLLSWTTKTPRPNAQIKSVAVLPFKPLTAENRDEALELGMADTLIAKLSDSEQLQVRPITAVRRFASPEQDPVQAGQQLGVDAVLDGGVQIANGRVRISARLLRVSDGKQIWSEKFDEQLDDIFAVQDSISERVSSALKVRLSDQSRKTYTESVEAYQLFMRGKLHAYRLVLPEVQQGISYYQQAIAADPSFALAYVELANAYRSMVLTNDALPSEMMPRSRAASVKAAELDPSLAEAWTALAFTNFWYDWNWPLSEEHLKKALELDPTSAQTHAYYAHLLSNTGRHAEAINEIKRAREIDPLDILINAIEGQILFFAGREAESESTLRSIILVNPDFWLAHFFISRIYIEKGMWTEAENSSRKAVDLTRGNAEATASLVLVLARSGRRDEAKALTDELEAKSRSSYVPSYALAQASLALGERAKALGFLERSFEQREPLMTFLKVDPKWDQLRNEPKFSDLMKRMNFEQR